MAGGTFQTKRGPANQPGQPANPTVKYTLLPDYRERFTVDGQQEIQQIALVAWEDVDNFELSVLPDVVLGGASISGPAGLITLTVYNTIPAATQNIVQVARTPLYRFDAEPHPLANWLYVADCELTEGVGFPGADPNIANAIAFYRQRQTAVDPEGMAKMVLTYRSRPYNYVDDNKANSLKQSELQRYVQRSYKPAGRPLVIPTNTQNPYLWVDYETGLPNVPYNPSGPGPAEARITMSESTTHFAYTWKMVPRVPRAIFEFLGLCNAYEFDVASQRAFSPLFFGARKFRPGTVVYDNCDLSEVYYTISGTPVVDITCHFTMVDNWIRGPFVNGTNAPTTRYGVGFNFMFRPSTRTYTRLIYESPLNAGNPFPNGDDPVPFIIDNTNNAPPNNTPPTIQGSPINYVDLNQLFMIDSDLMQISVNGGGPVIFSD